MTKVEVGANKKGALGEALVTGGQKPPEPMVETVESFVVEKYDVITNIGIDISFRPVRFMRVAVEHDERVSWQPDAVLEAKWVPIRHENEVEYRDGIPTNRWELPKESARFPIEVKTGEYAEFGRGQKETLETVAATDNQIHPILVRVPIDELPEAFSIKTDFF